MEENLKGNLEEGECPVCGKLARLKCSGCKSSFYCSKEHQKEDWPRHKSICHAWEIEENESIGRYLTARRDLKSGEPIISEVPLVWGAAPHHTSCRVCVGCGQRCEDVETRCAKCFWPSCSTDCKGLLAKDGHELECALLAKTRIFPRCDVLLAIRMLILWKTKSKRWNLLEKLESHEDSRGPGTDAYEEVQEITNHLGPLIAVDPSCGKILPKICGLIDVNALETLPPEGSVAIYRTACLLEHRCLPNTRHSFALDEKGRPVITVLAVTSIKKGEHLSTSYTHALWSTRARRRHLLATKYFSCSCERCADPTELGTHLGTLRCPYNDGGFILPRDPLDFETEWSCDKCEGTLRSSEVGELMDRLEEEVEEAMRTPNKAVLSDLLSRLRALLHPGHQHCISLGHSLIQLLSSNDPQKLELCNLITNTVAVVDPYGARLTLYAAITLRELADCPGQDKKEHLSKAMALLMPEPAKSPGAKLLRLIKSELEYL